MRALFDQVPILALAPLALLITACGGKDDGSEAANQQQGMEGFFKPAQGETWTYRVQKELPLEIELAEDDLARRPQRTDSGHLVTFERVRTCRGTRTLEGLDRPLTTMDIVESGTLLGQELYDIGPKGVFFRGWLPTGGDESRSLLTNEVKLASPGMQPGQSWTTTGADPNRQFLFRVIENAEITVPAGSFPATRIQIISDYEGKGLKRTVWFAENVGIVKEESVYYGPRHTAVRETAELVHFVESAPVPPQEAALVTLSGDEKPAPDLPDPASAPEDAPEPGIEGDPSPEPEEAPPADPETDEAAQTGDETIGWVQTDKEREAPPE